MIQRTSMDRRDLLDLVCRSAEAVARSKDAGFVDLQVGEDTKLLGEGSAFDSIHLVSLIVEVEQRLTERYGVVVTIADERAMNMRNSPFRSIGRLVDYLARLLSEDREK